MFALAAVLFVAAQLASPQGIGQGLLSGAAMLVFLAACIRAVGRAVRDDPVRSRIAGGRMSGYAGWIAAESHDARKRRHAARAAKREHARPERQR
jgi:uncharacterized membrane protein